MDRSSVLSTRSSTTSTSTTFTIGTAVAAAASLALAVLVASAEPVGDESLPSIEPSPPTQPASGFGGSDYPFAKVEHEAHGDGAASYWIFRPEGTADACDRPNTPPVVFLHGWGAMNPMYYGAWIEHLVRRGHVVVYPRYQESLRTPPAGMTAHVVDAVRSAFARLDVDCPWAVIGHSLGGALAANLAVRASDAGLGAPILLLAVQPGRALSGMRVPVIELDDLAALDAATVLVTVASDADTVVGDRDARRIFEGAVNVPAERKRYVVVRSDRHGSPPLEAGHHAPTAPLDAFDLLDDEPPRAGNRRGQRLTVTRSEARVVDALDYYAFWKLADALIALALGSSEDIFTTDNVRMLADMGEWSDGRAVAALSLHAAPPPSR